MKKNIALVTGGYSGEAEISYKSAKTVNANINRDLFEVYQIDVNTKGWFYVNEKGENCTVNQQNFTIIIENNEIKFDKILMCLHGTPGEDGKLQGYFDMLGLPYTSCNAATSAITFNKRYTLAVAAFSGICVAKSVHLFKENSYNIANILNQIALPVFVKPNNGGSSLGMSKVVAESDLGVAIEKAFAVDNQVLVEEMIVGREFTVGVFKNDGEILVLPITEIITENDFFDYEAKYLGKSQEITPAIVTFAIEKQLTTAAKNIYEILNCSGVVRVDFIYNDKEQLPYMLEINTVPGQSEASIIPQQVKAMGWTLEQFYTAVINNS